MSETTESFIKYVAAGHYDNTFIYGATAASFLRGGGYTFKTCAGSVGRIEPVSTIPLESTNSSNRSGVISMVRRNSATDFVASDWTINIAYNLAYDDPANSYIPLGRVLVCGMSVVETIAFINPAVGPENFGGPENCYFDEKIDCETDTQSNHISLKMMARNDNTTSPTAAYSTSTNTLTVNSVAEGKFLRLPFELEDLGNKISMTPKLDEIVEMEKPVPNMAMVDNSSRTLSIGTVEVDGVELYEDLVFSQLLSSPQRFVLDSYKKI
ncbi:MAG: hypothetical protein CMQ14_02085 [Gammaproteobacteria bacterium]|nr:hypothetical protein [Gammaproteobacteria bacterium]